MNLKKKILSTELNDNQIGLFYVGQLGFIIKFREKYLLIDGYLSEYVDENCSTEERPMVRKYPTPIRPEELDFIDFVFCTHDHADHTDPYTISGIASVNSKAKFIVPQGIADQVISYGAPAGAVCGVTCDLCYSLTDFLGFTAIPAAHEELHPDGNGGYMEVGYKISLGSSTLYHSGDCCPYEGLDKRVAGSDIMILPINGRDYFRRYELDFIGNFHVQETLVLAKRTGAKLLIPAHFDLYENNGQDVGFFVSEVYRIAFGQQIGRAHV